MLKRLFALCLLSCFFPTGAFAAAPQGSFPRAVNPDQPGGSYTAPAPTTPVVMAPAQAPPEPLDTEREVEDEYKPWQYEKYSSKVDAGLQEQTDDIFIRGLTTANPLSPERVREARQRAMQVEDARTQKSPDGGKAKFKGLSLKPGSPIPVLELFPGNVSVVTFLDSTGAPWPVLSFVVGNGEAFSVQRAGGETAAAANILMVTPTKQFADTSLAVTLEPETPIVVRLKVSPNIQKPDYLVTFRADAEGPRASVMYSSPEKNNFVDERMLSFLDGIAPEGATILRASDKSVEAWEMGGNYYLRTNTQMLWPAFKRVVKSSGAHETWLYEMSKVNSVVLGTGNSPRTVTLDSYPETMILKGVN